MERRGYQILGHNARKIYRAIYHAHHQGSITSIPPTRHHKFTFDRIPRKTRIAMEAQDMMGWRAFIVGRMAHSWEEAQHEWSVRDSTRFRGTAQSLSSAIAKGLLEICRSMQDHRNEILFDPNHEWAVQKRTCWNQEIHRHFDMLDEADWDCKDKRFFLRGREIVLALPDEAKQQWLASVRKAVDRWAHARVIRRNTQTSLRGWLLRSQGGGYRGPCREAHYMQSGYQLHITCSIFIYSFYVHLVQSITMILV